jgi:hypothetical protein
MVGISSVDYRWLVFRRWMVYDFIDHEMWRNWLIQINVNTFKNHWLFLETLIIAQGKMWLQIFKNLFAMLIEMQISSQKY